MEFDNVKAVLKDEIEITEGKEMKTRIGNGEYRNTTAGDVQELIRERLYNIADLLGMSDIYLDD